jgi:hypothetical protein
MFNQPPTYDVGNIVQLAYLGRGYLVTWRGQQKERLPSGVVIREWVYKLDDGHWDCYRAEDLAPFGQWHPDSDGRSK